MSKTFHGTVHGQTITINESLNLADGEHVEVVLKKTSPQQAWGDGIKRSAGAAVDVPDFDAVFEQIRQDRKAAQFREHGE